MIYPNFSFHYRSVSEHCPLQTQSFVHSILILTHLQDVHRLRKIHEISCSQYFDISKIVVYTDWYHPFETTAYPHLIDKVFCDVQ